MIQTIQCWEAEWEPVDTKEFLIRNPQILKNATEYLYSLDFDEEKPFLVIFKDFKKLRTDAQNRLYWSWLRIISKETGNSTKSLHADFTDMFLPKEIIETRRGKIERTISTTDLNTKEFAQYLNEVEAETGDFFGIVLPHPGDYEWLTRP